MNDTAVAGDGVLQDSAAIEKRWPALRRLARTLLYSYAVVLLLLVSVQAVCLLLVWRPSQDWVSFGARFATSPAIAGFFALAAAIVGAWQLKNQLTHTKEKAADEAWWQQFEWVTDRIIISSGKDDDVVQLPTSLAFDLTNSLSSSARAPFQKDAVDGILDHYLKDFVEQPKSSRGQEESSSSDGRGMDAAGAKSLRNLIDTLPESSPSGASARHVLQAYEYEQEVIRALDHRGFDLLIPKGGQLRADALLTHGSEKIVVETKRSIDSNSMLQNVGNHVRRVMTKAGASRGVIVTQPTEFKLSVPDLASEGIYLVEWEPSMRSYELRRQIDEVLNNGQA